MSKASRAERVSTWLARVTTAKQPPGSIVAYNVGVTETPKGYSAYLIGAEQYDPANDDWACREAFTPKERYLPLPRGDGNWEQALADVITGVRQFLSTPAGQASFLAQAVAVTVGFDDGGLERVYPVPPSE